MPRSVSNVIDAYLNRPLWWWFRRAPSMKTLKRWFRPRSRRRSERELRAFIGWQRRLDDQRAKHLARVARLERLDRLISLGLLPVVEEDQTLEPQIAVFETPQQPNAPCA